MTRDASRRSDSADGMRSRSPGRLVVAIPDDWQDVSRALRWALLRPDGTLAAEGESRIADLPPGSHITALVAASRVLFAVAKLPKRNAGRLHGALAYAIRRLQITARGARPDPKTAIEQAATANRMTLQPGEIAVQAGGRVGITRASVSGAAANAFIARLQSAHGLQLESLQMTALGEPDHVKLEAVFSYRQVSLFARQ